MSYLITSPRFLSIPSRRYLSQPRIGTAQETEGATSETLIVRRSLRAGSPPWLSTVVCRACRHYSTRYRRAERQSVQETSSPGRLAQSERSSASYWEDGLQARRSMVKTDASFR